MRSSKVLAALYLAVGFAAVSYIMLAIEPGMGFASPADYFDAVTVAAGYATTTWLVENVIYLSIPLAILLLVRFESAEQLVWSGLAAAGAFLVLGAIDRVGIQLHSVLSDPAEVRGAVASLLPIRLAVLQVAVVTLGTFAWTTTRSGVAASPADRTWKGLGWLVLAGSLLFPFIFLPMPIFFFLWSVGLTWRQASHPRDAPAVPAPSPAGS